MHGNIIKQDTMAIVNTANSSLLGGGGVDGAIHKAGGFQILKECKRIRAAQGGCSTGLAVITSGGNLPVQYVIHTVGPVWHGGASGESDLLHDAYHNSLLLAREKGIISISFPSISTGAYRFPLEHAAQIAINTVIEFITKYDTPSEIRFVLFSNRDMLIYKSVLEKSI